MVVGDLLQEVRDKVWDEEICHASRTQTRSACASTGHKTRNMSVVYVSFRVSWLRFCCCLLSTSYGYSFFVGPKWPISEEMWISEQRTGNFYLWLAFTTISDELWLFLFMMDATVCAVRIRESKTMCIRLCRIRIWTQNKCASNDLGGC